MEPFPIQSLAVPIGLGGHDIIGQARTGTGKTLAFGAPLLQRIEHGGRKPRGLVIVPTRELAIQVTDDLVIAGAKLGTRVLSVYGGRAYEPQIDALKNGVEVVVGTPGRLLDLLKQRHLDLSQVTELVLDEADRMLDLGFLPDIERLVAKVPAERHTMLFSATMPGEIVALSRKYLTRPTNVRAESHEESEATPQVVQHVFQAHQMDKPELLTRVLQARERGLTMVFCQTKRACDRVAEDLARRGFAAAAVHGDLGQGQRERALRAFRAGKIDVLVATDVAARGLDVDDVTHVVNYECPDSADTYVHRIGRTGRAGKEGIAVTLVDWADLPRWKLVNTALDLPFADPEETYSTSDHLYQALDIPADVTGTLPKERRERAGLEAEEVEDIGETGRVRTRDSSRVRTREESRPRSRERRQPRKRTRGGRPTAPAAPAGAPATADRREPSAPSEPADATTPASRPSRSRRAAEPGADGARAVPDASDAQAAGPSRQATRAASRAKPAPEDDRARTSASRSRPADDVAPAVARAAATEATDADAVETARPRGGAKRSEPAADAVLQPAISSAGVPVVEFRPPGFETTGSVEPRPRPQRRRRRRSRTGEARESA